MIATEAIKGEGIDTLVKSIDKHKRYFDQFEYEDYRLRKASYEIDLEIKDFLLSSLMKNIQNNQLKKKPVKTLALKKTYPKKAALEILKKIDPININKKYPKEII